jgi:hypothetical protein
MNSSFVYVDWPGLGTAAIALVLALASWVA